MPNWIYNKLTVTGKQAKEALDFMKSEANDFDFENLVPIPSYVYKGNLGMKERELFDEYNWYDWCCQHWGTKWNSSEAYRDGNTVTFQTAWSAVPKIIIHLASKFPEATYEYKYADEDFGCHTGYMTTSKERWPWIDLRQPENNSYEAFELAKELVPYSDVYEWNEETSKPEYCGDDE